MRFSPELHWREEVVSGPVHSWLIIHLQMEKSTCNVWTPHIKEWGIQKRKPAAIQKYIKCKTYKIDIPPNGPLSLIILKVYSPWITATSLHNCTAVYDTSNGSPSTIVHHNPANICDRTNGGSSSRRLVDSSDRSHSVDEFRRPLMNDTQVQTKDDTTQCISLSNNGLLTGSGQAGAGTNSVQTATTTVSAGTGVRSSSERKRTRSGGASGSRRFKRRSKPFCLRATLNNFSTFCRQTSLHGWQYIAQKNSSRAKHVFWAIMVSMSMATAAVFLYNNTMDYLNATVSTRQFLGEFFLLLSSFFFYRRFTFWSRKPDVASFTW